MEPLIIPGKRNTPSIWFDPSIDRFEMSGTSIPENANEFFRPVFNWLAANLPHLKDGSIFHFHFSYFNSTSLKAIFQVLRQLKEASVMGPKLEVRWYVEEDDEFMSDAAEMYMQLLDFKMQVVTAPFDGDQRERRAS